MVSVADPTSIMIRGPMLAIAIGAMVTVAIMTTIVVAGRPA
jgi:hypothetical protein